MEEEQIQKILETELSQPKNVQLFLKHLLPMKDRDDFKNILYQVIGDIANEKSLKETFNCLKKKLVGWNNPCFNNIKTKIIEHDDYLVNPFDLVEGIGECRKCGSKKTFSYAKQNRGCDEPMTTYSWCLCGNKWSYSG
jgi:DNA-directed RNA polymerase subunit M/transcription elongation factor TFIIS